MTYFIRAACLNGYEDIVRGYGQNPDKLLKNAGIIPSQLRDPDTFIFYDHFLKAIELASRECANDVFGLELGLKQSIHYLGMIKNYMCRQETLLSTLSILNKYIHFHAEGFSLAITSSDQYYRMGFHHLQQNYFTAQKAQYSLAAYYSILTELIGHDNHTKYIYLTQPKPLQNSHYFENKFRCKIHFSAKEDAIYVPKSLLLKKPAIQINTESQLPSDNGTSHQFSHLKTLEFIQQTIKSLLATGECNKNNIALCMGIHPKKLQRLLAENNTSYRESIEQVRRQEAIKLLRQPQLSLSMIALKLGYGELAIFSRNFKTWFNQTPSQWRQQNGLS